MQDAKLEWLFRLMKQPSRFGRRAPKWMQDAKLEWLFRLMKQPSRFGRMLALPKFVFAVRDEKSKKK